MGRQEEHYMEGIQGEYSELGLDMAYTLQNAGGLVLLCTAGDETDTPCPDCSVESSVQRRFDIAPIAWCCPLDYAPVSKFIIVCDTGHRSYEDLLLSKEFVLALPTAGQKDLVLATGSVSGRDEDKYAKFNIPAFHARSVEALVPCGVAGWIECSLGAVHVEGTSAIVTGIARRAFARPEAWSTRLHFVDEKTWFTPSTRLG